MHTLSDESMGLFPILLKRCNTPLDSPFLPKTGENMNDFTPGNFKALSISGVKAAGSESFSFLMTHFLFL